MSLKSVAMPLVALILSITFILFAGSGIYLVYRHFEDNKITDLDNGVPDRVIKDALGVNFEGNLCLITPDGHLWGYEGVQPGVLYTVVFDPNGTMNDTTDDRVIEIEAK